MNVETLKQKIKDLINESENHLKNFCKDLDTTIDNIRDWDDLEVNASYEVGFYDALNEILKVLER